MCVFLFGYVSSASLLALAITRMAEGMAACLLCVYILILCLCGCVLLLCLYVHAHVHG